MQLHRLRADAGQLEMLGSVLLGDRPTSALVCLAVYAEAANAMAWYVQGFTPSWPSSAWLAVADPPADDLQHLCALSEEEEVIVFLKAAGGHAHAVFGQFFRVA